MPEFPALPGDLKTEVLIIGGGLAGILCDMVQGREDGLDGIFSPSRSVLRPQLFANAAGSALHLLKPTRPRCPHLGCALTWDPKQRVWECPCHGSRFDHEGRLLDGPATGDLER